MDISLLEEHGCIIVKANGAISDADVAEIADRLQREPKARFFDALYDYSDVSDLSALGIDTVRRLSDVIACPTDSLPKRKIAIVAPRDALFGLARMHQTRSEPFLPAMRVFRDLAAALEYLGLPMPCAIRQGP